jgi:hypothetical protein
MQDELVLIVSVIMMVLVIIGSRIYRQRVQDKEFDPYIIISILLIIIIVTLVLVFDLPLSNSLFLLISISIIGLYFWVIRPWIMKK